MVGGFEDRPHGRIESWLGLAMGEEDGECAEDSELRPSHESDLGVVVEAATEGLGVRGDSGDKEKVRTP
jgi:hypothetical protein